MHPTPSALLRRCAAAFLVLLALGSCGRFAVPKPSSATPVILITIDTLRSDHLPVYGYTGVSTPNIDALRADSILYERAYTHCPLTLPAHTSIMTGRLPSGHGVRDNIGYRLDAKIPTLAELLKKNGYATGAAISAFVLRRESGISRGFDSYDDDVEPLGDANAIGRVQREGDLTTRAAKTWLDQHQSKPFFLFVHLYEPHTPYQPPEPFRSRYASRYDGEIAHVDQIVGSFLEDLKSRGLYDEALIVLLSDHGEGLNEHGEEEHGIFLYRETLQVPLLVKLPRSAKKGSSVSAPVALVDVFPTILEQTATAVPQPGGEARSLLAALNDDVPARSIYSETYYPRLHFGWSDLHSLIAGDQHFIRAPQPELYDLATDPGEKKNAIEENRRAYVRLRTEIEPFVKKADAPAQIDPEEVAKLAALGYVGSTVTETGDEDLPDPKTTIDVFRQIRVAYTYFRDDRYDDALELTNKLLADNDMILDLWDLKSKILAQLGRNEEAIETARAGLKKQSNSVGLLMTVANLSILTGELEQARDHAELLLKTEPARAHEIMARIAIHQEDFALAKNEAELSIKESHEPASGYVTLGLIEKQQGKLDAAMAYFDQAMERIQNHKNKRVPNLHFYRGDAFARLGRNEEAEREFRAEIAAYPKSTDAYGSLILLLATQRRLDEATALVFELVKKAPTVQSYSTISTTLKAIGDDRGAVYWARQGLKRFPSSPELRDVSRVVAGGVPRASR
jgi:arylsulfatase A-like enzyme/Tfp pilus assembly protein PilF